MPARNLVLTDSVGSLELMLYSDQKTAARINVSWDPPSGGPRDVVYRDFKNGYGYSQPGIVNDGYAYGLTVDARSPGVVVPAGAVTEIDLTTGLGGVTPGPIANNCIFTDVNGHLWMIAGRYGLKFTNGVGAPSVGFDLGVGTQAGGVTQANYGGTPYTWIGVSGSSSGFAKFDGTTLTTTATFARVYLTNVFWATTDGVAVQRLIGLDSNYTVRHCALTNDPMSVGNWSAAITVGDGTWAVTGFAATGRHVYIVTTGGLYDLDDLGQTVNLAPYLADGGFDNLAGRVATVMDGFVMYGAANGLDAIDVRNPGVKQTAANWALPGDAVGIPNETPIYGRPTAFARDGGWLVMAIFNGTDSYVLYGKRRDRLGFPGPGEWIWHGSFAQYSSQVVLSMAVKRVVVAGVVSRRLWVATITTDTGATRVFWQSLPVTTTARQDALVSSAHRFSTGASLYLTPAQWEPGKLATLTQATIESRALTGTTNTLALAAAVNDSPTFSSTLMSSKTSPLDVAPVASAAISGAQITPRLTFVGTATTPSVLRSLTLTAGVDPNAAEVWEFDVVFARETALNSGAHPAHQSPERDYTVLASMQSRLVSLQGPTGDTYTFLLETALPGAWFQAAPDGHSQARSWLRKVTVRGQIVDRPPRFGEDALFGRARFSA